MVSLRVGCLKEGVETECGVKDALVAQPLQRNFLSPFLPSLIPFFLLSFFFLFLRENSGNTNTNEQ